MILAIRWEDPPEWSFERLEWRNEPWMEQLYRGWVRDLRGLLHDDWDMPIVTTGVNGAGKSAWSLNLASDLDDTILENLPRHCHWYVAEDIARFERMVATMEPSVIILDEAGVDAQARDFASAISKRMVKLFTIAREFNHAVIMNIPDFHDLDNYFRDRRVQFRVWVDWITDENGDRHRAKATVRRREKTEFMKGAYWPGLFTIRFPDIHPSIRDEYRRNKRENTLRRLGVLATPTLTEQEELVWSAKQRGMTYRDIGIFLDCSHTKVARIFQNALKKVEEEALV